MYAKKNEIKSKSFVRAVLLVSVHRGCLLNSHINLFDTQTCLHSYLPKTGLSVESNKP